jgi:hypothetical protein
MLLPFERGMFAVSLVGTRVEPPQNCYIAQIPGHTNYAISLQHWFTLFPRDGSSDYSKCYVRCV